MYICKSGEPILRRPRPNHSMAPSSATVSQPAAEVTEKNTWPLLIHPSLQPSHPSFAFPHSSIFNDGDVRTARAFKGLRKVATPLPGASRPLRQSIFNGDEIVLTSILPSFIPLFESFSLLNLLPLPPLSFPSAALTQIPTNTSDTSPLARAGPLISGNHYPTILASFSPFIFLSPPLVSLPLSLSQLSIKYALVLSLPPRRRIMKGGGMTDWT